MLKNSKVVFISATLKSCLGRKILDPTTYIAVRCTVHTTLKIRLICCFSHWPDYSIIWRLLPSLFSRLISASSSLILSINIYKYLRESYGVFTNINNCLFLGCYAISRN